jgi:hypothetical protein
MPSPALIVLNAARSILSTGRHGSQMTAPRQYLWLFAMDYRLGRCAVT